MQTNHNHIETWFSSHLSALLLITHVYSLFLSWRQYCESSFKVASFVKQVYPVSVTDTFHGNLVGTFIVSKTLIYFWFTPYLVLPQIPPIVVWLVHPQWLCFKLLIFIQIGSHLNLFFFTAYLFLLGTSFAPCSAPCLVHTPPFKHNWCILYSCIPCALPHI